MTRDYEYTIPLGPINGTFQVSSNYDNEKDNLIIKCKEIEFCNLIPVGTLTRNNGTFSTNFNVMPILSISEEGDYILYAVKKRIEQ